MRFTKFMGLAVILVAIALTVNAMAFKTATVTNPTTLTVSSTTGAALAFDVAASPGTGFTTTIPGAGGNQRQLQIQITDAMQPNSVYRYTKVFKVTNSASGTPATTLSVDTTAFPAGITVTLYKGDGLFTTAFGGMILNTGTPTTDVDVEISVSNTYAGTGGTDLGLKITGTQ